MKIYANGKEIQIDVSHLQNLVNQDLDSSNKNALNGYLWQIAEAFGISDQTGNS
jgi:ABC-type polysaccharide/polyol phosphate export permease